MHVTAHKQRPPLHPLERAYLTVLLAQLIFMPWAYGSMHPRNQLIALVLSVAGLGLALWPRVYTEELSGGKEFTLQSWPRLRRFPLFWLGAGLLILLLVQAANPTWQWQRNPTQWWLQRLESLKYLPTSVAAPFERSNVWREFIVYALVWLTVCSLWIGITRRKSLHILLGGLVLNGVVLGLVGFAHKASGASKVLWLREFPGAASFASFVYQNHAGAYFSLVSFLALGLAVWHFFDARKRLAKSSPAALWFIAALLLVFGVIFSLSRGAIISLAVFWLAAALASLILRLTSATRSTTPPIVTGMVALGIIGAVGWMVKTIDFTSVCTRFEEFSKFEEKDLSYIGRKLVRKSAAAMYADHWVLGVGAGGFRHLFPQYIKDKPLVYEGGQAFWEHAHIDWLEVPIELGLTGVLLLAGGFGWIVWRWGRSGGWRHPLALMMVIGAGQIMAHALIDFPFQCPAILATWWVLLVAALRWLELERG